MPTSSLAKVTGQISRGSPGQQARLSGMEKEATATARAAAGRTLREHMASLRGMLEVYPRAVGQVKEFRA
jgi:hypothetical protein